MEGLNCPVYVINMDVAKDRWERISKRLDKYYVSYTRWHASTPETLDGYPIYPYMRPGEKGCGLSHFRLWMHIVQNQIPYALIFEDDARLRDGWYEALVEKLYTIEHDDPEWDCLMLCGYDKTLPVHQWVRTEGNATLSGYVLSLRGATWLVDTFGGMILNSDWMSIPMQKRGHTYSYFPWFVLHEGKDSYLQPPEKFANDYKHMASQLEEHGFSESMYQ